jgi:tetratricopeptide (TPR) repeat protein
MRWFVLAALCLGLASYAQKNPELEKAQKLLASKKYADALKALEAAEKKGGLDHDSYMTLLESKGLCQASLKKADAATDAFKALLALDPRRDLEGKYKGDVVTAISAAQEWVKANGALVVAAREPLAQGGKVKQVSLQVKSDPLKWAQAARIHVKQADGSWKPADVAFTDGVAKADTDAATVELWAEVHDAQKNQLLFVGSSIRPVKQSAPAEVAEAPKPAPAPAPEPEKPAAVAAAAPAATAATAEPAPAAAVEVSETPKSSGSALRTVSYPVFGVGVVAAAVGIYFGASASSARTSILADQMAATMTAQMLYDRDQARIGQATAANALFITAGVLAVAAIVMFIAGG